MAAKYLVFALGINETFAVWISVIDAWFVPRMEVCEATVKGTSLFSSYPAFLPGLCSWVSEDSIKDLAKGDESLRA